MGCYGIGVGRTLAAAIEQNHDPNGMIFPIPVAPFEATILPLQMHAPDVVAAAEKIYSELSARNCEVLLDDRNERAGVKFNDAELLGIPVCITVGSRGTRRGRVEIKLRASGESFDVPLNEAPAKVQERIQELYDSLK
jgi:prolyl-tRNA synthetase